MLQEGLARFATSDYRAPGASKRSIKDRYMHLTNYSVNKKSSDYERNTDAEKVLGVRVGGRSRGKGRGRVC